MKRGDMIVLSLVRSTCNGNLWIVFFFFFLISSLFHSGTIPSIKRPGASAESSSNTLSLDYSYCGAHFVSPSSGNFCLGNGLFLVIKPLRIGQKCVSYLLRKRSRTYEVFVLFVNFTKPFYLNISMRIKLWPKK